MISDDNLFTVAYLTGRAQRQGFTHIDLKLKSERTGEKFSLFNFPVSDLGYLGEALLINEWEVSQTQESERRKHNHYFKDVRNLDYIDVYRVLDLFEVKDPCLGHAVKKLLVSGNRGGGKDTYRDIQEAIDSLERYKEMRREENEINRN